MRSLHLLVLLSCLMWIKADMLGSFTVCVRFKITHFRYNFMALESRDAPCHTKSCYTYYSSELPSEIL